MAATGLVEVALPIPLFRTFTYAVPAALAARVQVGSRVVAPVRGKKEIGICVGFPESVPEGVNVKPILDAPDLEPVVDAPVLALARWMAEYYVVPLGIALRCVLPAALTGATAPEPAVKTRRVVTIGREIPSLLHRERIFARAPQQRALYELLEQMGGRAPVALLEERLSFSPSVLKGLVARGFASVEDEVVARDPFASRAARAPEAHVPTEAQAHAIAELTAAKPGEVFLLHGVTGSGKTLVYVELLRHVVRDRGRSAIVLVPEIALTPQTVDRFRAAFGDEVAVLHSALSDGERYDAWLALRRGEKRIAVGARSAIFAPLRDVGAIVVDEEHESSYKQGESPRYHARELAIVRARAEGGTVVLGSATPCLETWENARWGKFRLLTLPDRAGAGRLPKVSVVDLNAQPKTYGNRLRQVISEPLEKELAANLQRGEQSILLLNRRGFSSFVQCSGCGDVAACPNCSISLTYHRAPERLVCHYCLHHEPPRETCRRCASPTLQQRGLGTQQVERLLCERFASARITRMDVDTTSGKWAHADILDKVGRGEVDILLGTQMIAKGLDFPNVTLVGVVDADVGINLPDFRASERCFQLLSQVAGRAGRGPKGGRVLIQTRSPSHHAVTCAVKHDFHGFVNTELPGRESPAYPPTLRLANVVFSGTTEAGAEALAQRGADWWRRAIRKHPDAGISVIGPAPCPVERIKQRWRWHILIKCTQAGSLTRFGRAFLERFEVPNREGLRVALDRDPATLL